MLVDPDPKTGLAQRDAFFGHLHREVARSNDHGGKIALLIVDIDEFAQINAGHGYAVGDEVLRHVARQLRALARKHDFVARIGDNRFALLLSAVINHGHVALAGQKLQRLLDVPFEHDEVRMRIAVSVGAAVCPEHASHGEFLLRRAEIALATARQQDESFCLARAESGRLDLSEQWQLEMALDSALERDELRLEYQPQLRLSDRRVVGAEALMRWHSPQHGVIDPQVFIPLAERGGQIRNITLWALNTALRQARGWPRSDSRFTVSVNLPSQMAARRDLPELVDNALRLWGCPQVRLCLEITERSLMDQTHSSRILQRIRELGVDISIDDFGTGYSCLAYFKNIPADELKIDQSFVRGMASDTANREITSVIIDLAHRFHLRVVGEGIEDRETLELLRARQCDLGQGFLFGKAMPADVFTDWLSGQATDT